MTDDDERECERQRFIQSEDVHGRMWHIITPGVVWKPSQDMYFNARELRWIADELDKRNGVSDE